MVQKKRRISAGRKCFFGLIAIVGVVSVLWGQSFVSLADSTGTVKADSANIREKADTNSDVIGSASSGTTLSIKDEVQDSSGTLWYQVYVNANTTGYIRADLVDKKDGDGDSQSSGGQTASQGDSRSESSASGALEGPDNVMDAQYAVITAEKIIVRTAPSTNEGVVDRLVQNDQVVVSGQSNGSDGKLWYFVTFTGESGAEKTGFIRSDLLSLGEMVPVQEEETPEPEVTVPEPETPVNDDYKLTYEPSLDVWYLYDNTDGQNNPYLVSDLMKVTRQRSEEDAANAKALVRQRIAIIVLIVLLVIVIAVAVVMALKLRDVYYEEYEDEDEEEQEEEVLPKRKNRAAEADETPVRRKNRTDEEEEAPRRRRSRADEEEEAPRRRRSRADEEEEAPRRRRSRADEEETTQRRRRTDETERRRRRVDEEEAESVRPAGTSQKRKTKNFLLDDDEFEFEFLNMEDKDS